MLIGTDRALFAEGSPVRARIARFGQTHTEALDSIVFSTRVHGIEKPQELAPHVHAYPTNSRSRLLYGWDALSVARALPRPDLVSAQDPFETGLIAWRIARSFNVPLMVEMHTDFLAPSFAAHSLSNRLRVMLAGFVLKRAVGGYAVSERVRTEMMARYSPAGTFGVLPIFVDTERFASLPRRRHPRFEIVLLWVGRLEEEKQPFVALDALQAARREGFAAGLTFVGAGSLRAALEAQVRRENLTEWVEFAGARNPALQYAEADLLLVTSKYEGYGMVVIEALAAGVPVLATDVGIAREAGATIAQGDYTAALVAWLKGPRRRGKLLRRPYESEEDYFTQVVRLYHSCLP